MGKNITCFTKWPSSLELLGYYDVITQTRRGFQQEHSKSTFLLLSGTPAWNFIEGRHSLTGEKYICKYFQVLKSLLFNVTCYSLNFRHHIKFSFLKSLCFEKFFLKVNILGVRPFEIWKIAMAAFCPTTIEYKCCVQLRHLKSPRLNS